MSQIPEGQRLISSGTGYFDIRRGRSFGPHRDVTDGYAPFFLKQSRSEHIWFGDCAAIGCHNHKLTVEDAASCPDKCCPANNSILRGHGVGKVKNA